MRRFYDEIATSNVKDKKHPLQNRHKFDDTNKIATYRIKVSVYLKALQFHVDD